MDQIQSISEDSEHSLKELFRYSECQICGGEKSCMIYPIDKEYAAKYSGIDINQVSIGVYRCNNCYHQYVQPLPQPLFLKAFYSSYMSKASNGFYRESLEDEIPYRFRQHYGKWLKQIKILHPTAKSILDVGAGFGMFLRLAKEYGFEGVGVEPNTQASEFIKEKYGFEIYNSMLEDVESEKNYDIITMWDLLEHLPNPRIALQKVNGITTQGGFLVIELPARDSFIHLLVKGIYRMSFGYIKRPLFSVYGIHHLQYFSKKSIIDFLNNNGFKVIEVYRCQTNVKALLKKSHKKFSILICCYNLCLRLSFLLGKILKKQNKMVVFAKKNDELDKKEI